MKKAKKTFAAAVKSRRYAGAVVSLVTCLMFFGFLITAGAVTLFSEKQEFSETLNRRLADAPELTGKKIFNGSFTDDTSEYITDHFMWHDGWIKLNTLLELASGRRELNDIYILKDRLVEKIAEPDPVRINKSVNGIRKFAEDNDVTPYIMLIPTQAEIYKDQLPAYAPNPDQQEIISQIYESLSDTAVTIDAYSTLSAAKQEYIYYRTDHHWTSLGAFYGYTAAARKMDITPLTQAAYDIEHAGEDFLGTFYSKVLYDGVKADTLDLWYPTEESSTPQLFIYSTVGEEPEQHDGLYFREYLDVKDKYSTFLGTNQPLIKIQTGNEGGKLLLIKDSYAHAMVPFLSAHYSMIDMIDLRYMLSYKDVVDVSEYDDVLFVYNVSTFITDDNLKMLAAG